MVIYSPHATIVFNFWNIDYHHLPTDCPYQIEGDPVFLGENWEDVCCYKHVLKHLKESVKLFGKVKTLMKIRLT